MIYVADGPKRCSNDVTLPSGKVQRPPLGSPGPFSTDIVPNLGVVRQRYEILSDFPRGHLSWDYSLAKRS